MAYESLREEKGKLVDAYEQILLAETEAGQDADPEKNTEKQLSELIAKKLALMKDRQWRYKLNNKSIEVREQVERIVTIIDVVKNFIASAARLDSLHAGLPWAGVCMLIVVSCPDLISLAYVHIALRKLNFCQFATNDIELRTAAIDGAEYVSQLVRRCSAIEWVYLQNQICDFEEILQTALLKLYRLCSGEKHRCSEATIGESIQTNQ